LIYKLVRHYQQSRTTKFKEHKGRREENHSRIRSRMSARRRALIFIPASEMAVHVCGGCFRYSHRGLEALRQIESTGGRGGRWGPAWWWECDERRRCRGRRWGRRGRGRAMGGGAVVGGDGGAGAAQWSATQRCADQIIAGTFI
jgi:hypothetical protein